MNLEYRLDEFADCFKIIQEIIPVTRMSPRQSEISEIVMMSKASRKNTNAIKKGGVLNG